MEAKRTRVLVALGVLAAAPAARAGDGVSVMLEATVGAQRLGMTRVPGSDRPLAASSDLGGTLLLRWGGLELGAAGEGDLGSGVARRFDASALGGLATDLAFLRIEVLGEVGAAGLRSARDVAAAAAGSSAWTRFYGVRPGLSVGVPALPLRVGVWGLARWGLPGTGPGPAYGMLGRVALQF